MELDPGLIAHALNLAPPLGKNAKGPRVLDARSPLVFWKSLLEALAAGQSVVLPDPSWPAAWRETLLANATADPIPRSILIATSGSTALPKWCRHDLATLGTAAFGFATRYQSHNLAHSVVVLPQHHVGGLLPVLRSAACGGRVHFADYRHPESFQKAPFALRQASLSLVPTQLSRLLRQEEGPATLRAFGAVFIGGASCPMPLLDEACQQQIRLAPCYGATESAAMVTALDPDAFLNGRRGVGQAMPHAAVSLDAEGRLQIQSDALFRGYLDQPPRDPAQPYAPSDIGRWDEWGSLHILQRTDRVLLSGGELVHPEAVEAAVKAAIPGATATCIGVTDPLWGHRIELVLTLPPETSLDEPRLLEDLKKRLPPAAVPKRIHLRSGPLKA